MKVTKSLYGTTKDGKEVYSFVIENSSGAYIELLNYGATLNKIVVPDSDGKFADVLVGFDTMEGQKLCTDSQGRTVGRVANRIDSCGITIDGKHYAAIAQTTGVTVICWCSPTRTTPISALTLECLRPRL